LSYHEVNNFQAKPIYTLPPPKEVVLIFIMNYLGASSRGIKKANAQGESGTDPRVEVLNQKENKI
jgi:hypothetical protein